MEDRNLQADLARALRRQLLALARLEDDRADAEAARLPYWAPCPSSVVGHRAAAAALRVDADNLLATGC